MVKEEIESLVSNIADEFGLAVNNYYDVPTSLYKYNKWNRKGRGYAGQGFTRYLFKDFINN